MGKEEKEIKLNPKQELFCKTYATEKEFFGNGVQAYAEAYDIDQSKPNWYKSTQVSACRLLSNPKIITRIQQLLDMGGFNHANVDKQLSFLIGQHADFKSKLGAIKEYNALKKRVDKKVELEGNIQLSWDKPSKSPTRHGPTS